MKSLIFFIALFCTFSTFAQTSPDFLQNGINKHKQQDYAGAIKDYDKAIKADKQNDDAYYNRGTCQLALKDLKGALTDFNHAIALNPKYYQAYYSRATVLVSQEKYKDALPDLDKAIALNAALPNALSLRGQIRAQTGDKKGACEDFNQAQANGDKNASKYLSQFCGNEQLAGESLMLNWPENENWKVASSQDNEKMGLIELIPANETLQNWTEMGNMMTIKGATNVPVDKAMNLMFEQAKQKSPKAKLTFIEKDETAEYPWIIFMIEAPNFKNDKRPESQVWYVVQGKTALYSNFRAVKQATITPAQKDKWVAFFKTGKVVQKR